jgi:hypothetical protein
MITSDSQLIRRFAVWITAAVCTYPLGVGAGAHLLSPWPSLQRDFSIFGLVTAPFVVLGCIGWIIAARMEYWSKFPIWQLLAWLALCVSGALPLLARLIMLLA